MKFDSILGNPPYNTNRDAGKGSTSVLWPKFVDHALNYTKDGGHVLYIHPSPWRKPNHPYWNRLSKLRMEYVKMFSLKKSKSIFDVGTKVDFYCIKNTKESSETIVVDENEKELKLKLTNFPFLPGSNIPFILNLLANENEPKTSILYDTTYHGVFTKEVACDEYTHKVIHTINKKGIKFRYTNRTDGHYGIKKIIINETGRPYPFNDYDGKYAMSQETFGIVVNTPEEAENVIKAIASDKFYEKVVCSTRWSNFRFDYKMMKYFRKDFYKDFL